MLCSMLCRANRSRMKTSHAAGVVTFYCPGVKANFLLHFLYMQERQAPVKMRVAIAFFLLISISMAFKIEKENSFLEDEQGNELILMCSTGGGGGGGSNFPYILLNEIQTMFSQIAK